jgi:hypothetical protein
MECWANWLQTITDHVRNGKYQILYERQPMKMRKEEGKMVYSHHVTIVTPSGYHDIRVEASQNKELV